MLFSADLKSLPELVISQREKFILTLLLHTYLKERLWSSSKSMEDSSEFFFMFTHCYQCKNVDTVNWVRKVWTQEKMLISLTSVNLTWIGDVSSLYHSVQSNRPMEKGWTCVDKDPRCIDAAGWWVTVSCPHGTWLPNQIFPSPHFSWSSLKGGRGMLYWHDRFLGRGFTRH